jgi:WD repeat-containing protein 19
MEWFWLLIIIQICASFQQYGESAVLYEKAEYWDKAAAVYIKTKNW